MLRIKSDGLKAPAFASLALAFASFGDAFLYPFLPVNNSVVGVPVVWVGVLLSINRFVRIVANRWMVHLFSKYGLRTIMIVAMSVALASTAGYAFAGSVVVWLFLRICWGLAFSAMRIGTIGYAIEQPRQGLALGISKSLQEIGPMFALLLTPVLLNSHLDTSNLFLALFTLSTPALWFAWNLPVTNDKTSPTSEKPFLSIPSTHNFITLTSAMLIDGIMIIVLGVLFLNESYNITPLTATALAAFYLGYRRICLVVLSPLGGWIADKVGLHRVFNFTIAFVIAGLLLVSAGWIEIGVIIVFTFYSINSAVTPGAVSKGNSHPLSAVSENATWRDLGAAFGTLFGGMLLSTAYLNVTLIIAIFILLIPYLVHLSRSQKLRKTSVVWK